MVALEIIFVSDIVCPWCAIGLHSLERALAEFPGVEITRRLMPFELNPGLSAEGEELVPYLSRKYGMSTAQVMANQEAIRQRGAEVGFEFCMDLRTRTYNTRAAHRLLAWAGQSALPEAQWQLKKYLLAAYFTQGQNPGAPTTLIEAARAVGLDPEAAEAVLESKKYESEVENELRQAQAWGIQAVPATVLNQKYLVSGGQPVEAFVQAIREAIT